MTLEEQARLSCYKTISTLDEDHGVMIVQHTETHKIFVKKTLSVYNRRVYDYLKTFPVKGTPRIYEVFENENQLIVIEEYIQGNSLDEKLKESRSVPERQATLWMRQLCQIVMRLHACRPPIIHRDIKPSNVMLRDSGEVCLLDMNAARQASSMDTHDTRMMGTAGYAAPEQYGFGASDERTDIYALGVLLNVLLTGELPTKTLAAGRFRELIRRSTRLESEERHPTVHAFLEELEYASGAVQVHEPNAPTRRMSLRNDRLPGFRTDQTYRWILSALGYLLIFAACFSMDFENMGVAQEWLNRIITLLMILSIVLFSGNYRGVQHLVRVDEIKNPKRRKWVIVLIDFGIVCVWMFLLVDLEKILFK